jgi:hypothetical protein
MAHTAAHSTVAAAITGPGRRTRASPRHPDLRGRLGWGQPWGRSAVTAASSA